MGDEAGLGNVIERVVVCDKTLIGNNHTGMVVGSHVRDVTIEGNTFQENGRQVSRWPTTRPSPESTFGATRLCRPTATVCASNCSSYEVTHISVGAGAHVSIAGNRYRPSPPGIIGDQDTAPVP